MKKFVSFILSLVMMLSVLACTTVASSAASTSTPVKGTCSTESGASGTAAFTYNSKKKIIRVDSNYAADPLAFFSTQNVKDTNLAITNGEWGVLAANSLFKNGTYKTIVFSYDNGSTKEKYYLYTNSNNQVKKIVYTHKVSGILVYKEKMSFEYNNAGRITKTVWKVTDSELNAEDIGQVVSKTYSYSWGRLKQIKVSSNDADNNKTSATYDVTTDSLGRITQMTNSEQTETYAVNYDSNGYVRSLSPAFKSGRFTFASYKIYFNGSGKLRKTVATTSSGATRTTTYSY